MSTGWFGRYDKLAMTRIFLRERLGLDLDEARDRIVFCGDSPNDAPMFGFCPYACGVANVRDFEGAMAAAPAFVASKRGAEGLRRRLPSGYCRRGQAIAGRSRHGIGHNQQRAQVLRRLRGSPRRRSRPSPMASSSSLLGPRGAASRPCCGWSPASRAITAGEISIGNVVVNDLHPKDRNIAMVFQNYALYRAPDRVRQHGVLDAAQEASEGGDQAQGGVGGIDPQPPRPISTASRGNCRAASASAWRWAARSCVIPAVFLFDEPLSNLDAKLRVQMRTEIKELHQQAWRPPRSTSRTTRSKP